MNRIAYFCLFFIGLLLNSCSWATLRLAKEDIRISRTSEVPMWLDFQMRPSRINNCSLGQNFLVESDITISKDKFRVFHHGDSIPFNINVWREKQINEKLPNTFVVDSTSIIDLYFHIKPLVNGDSLKIVEYDIPDNGDSIIIDLSIKRYGDRAWEKRIIRD
ncbi:hypothetical protein [uncultured Prevotella sp.]|uniref:hypothetical protein n=1 Tax=uncultured Prevotella sp. TaxID=159272 RepID=UPI0025E4D5C5|nr:hypothetical protein [uncultured Prevotella sp.]